MTVSTSCRSCGGALLPGSAACAVCGAPSPLAPPDTSPADEIETRLRAATAGDYEIRGQIGRGGMAAVYLARDLRLNRRVAIKVLLPELSSIHTMAARFNREAQIAAALSHPNIIVLHSVESAGGLHFLVMSFVEGCSLDLLVREIGALPVPLAQLVLLEVARALQYSHGEGVVHRDVKPGNILLDVRGRAVVTDFGIARAAEAPHLTQTGTAVGTPSYMSPEQCMGRQATAASDQYSLGVVAYELLTGSRPFVGATLEIQWAHATATARPVSALRPDCPPTVAAAVMRMLEKLPEDRWPSLHEAGLALADGLTNEDAVRASLAALARARAERNLGALGQTPASPVPHFVAPQSPMPDPAATGAGVAAPVADEHVWPPPAGATPAPPAEEQDAPAAPPVGSAAPAAPDGGEQGESQPANAPVAWTRAVALLSGRPRMLAAIAGVLVAAGVLFAVQRSNTTSDGGDVTPAAQPEPRIPPAPAGPVAPPVVNSGPGPKIETLAPDSAPPAVGSVELLVPANRRRLSVGGRLTARVRVRGVDGDSIPPPLPVEWASSDTAVARVSADGVVTGRARGSVTITGAVGGASARVTLAVVERRLRIRTVAGIDLVEGDSVRLDARVVDANMDGVEVRDRVVTVATGGLRHVSYDSASRYIVGRQAGLESLMLAGGEGVRLILPVRVRPRSATAKASAAPDPTRDELRGLAQHVATLIGRRQRAELERLFAAQTTEGTLPGVVARMRKSKVAAAAVVGEPMLGRSAGTAPTIDLAVRYRWSRKMGFGADDEIACLRALLRRPGGAWEIESLRQIRCPAPGVSSAPADRR